MQMQTAGGASVQVQPIARNARVEKRMMRTDVKRTDGSHLYGEVTTTTVMVRDSPVDSQRVKIVEPVVGPSGRFIEVELITRVEHPGMRHAVIGSNGLVQLTRHAMGLGFVLYYDMCRGAVEGVDASPRHWQIWAALQKMRLAGRVPLPGEYPAEKIFHPEIIHRRATVKRGLVHLDGAAMDREIGDLIAEAAALPEAERKRLVEVARDQGMIDEDADLEELMKNG